MSFLLSAAPLFAVFLGALPSPAQAAQAKPAWELEWAQIVEAAKKEGQVTVYHTRGPFDEVFADFNKQYPGIKLVSVTGRGGELSSRIMAERRGDKYLADIYMGSSGTPFEIFYPAKVLEPLLPLLILPEVREPSNWFRAEVPDHESARALDDVRLELADPSQRVGQDDGVAFDRADRSAEHAEFSGRAVVEGVAIQAGYGQDQHLGSPAGIANRKGYYKHETQ